MSSGNRCRVFLEKEPISTLYDEVDLQPTVFYRWQKEFFENGAAAFEQKARPEPFRRTGTDRLPGTLIGTWVPHDTRDQIVDFVRRWSEKTEIGAGRFIGWLDITASKFYDWRERYGKVNEHNGWVPRDFWLEDWEKQAIIGFHLKNPLEGYRRLTFMMLDADIVAVSPTSVWRVLGQAGLLSKWNGKPSKKGTGFEQPLAAHQHWHIDVSYINISGTFYYLCSILDGCSRYIVNWDLRESMTEADIEIILERAKELHPEARPRIISDTGRSSLPKTSRNSFESRASPTSELRPTIPNRTEKSNVGTNRSRGSASGRERRCRWKMRGDWCRATSSITTTFA
jgi:putative transposase